MNEGCKRMLLIAAMKEEENPATLSAIADAMRSGNHEGG